MDKRKLFGTIIGIIFWSFCVIFFTYAYYDWKSDPTNIVLGIEDLSLECLVGADVEVSNIGPVLNYQDGVKTEFSINNAMTDNMTIELYLDITSISDNLLTDSFKYVLVADSTGGTNYDYNNPLLEGDFSNFNIGNNLITQDLEVISEITTNYQFIIYIDGNMYNDPNMQENSLVGNLLIGKCSGDSVPYDELVYQAIYSETDNSLTFVHTTPLTVGDTYNDKLVSAVYTGFETANYTQASKVPWYKDGNYQNITTVNFDSVISPKSTAFWFYGFNNLTDIDLYKLDTSDVTTMYGMFYNCSSLTELAVTNFNTSKVTNMTGMFRGCSSLTSLDVSNFDTSNVTVMGEYYAYAGGMFQGCSNLTSLDLSNFDTSKVTNMLCMFDGCSSLTSLDLSNFNTSKVTNIGYMFRGCNSLVSLDLSNFDINNVTSFYMMFYNCNSLTTLDLSSFGANKVTNAYYMFAGCGSLIELNISNLDTSSITDMQSMFLRCSKLVELDVSNFNIGNAAIGNMFYGCSSLTSLDVSNWDTSEVTGMNSLFQGCSKLVDLNVSNFDTSKVTTMNSMFYGCNSLIELDLSNWNTDNVTNMQAMFINCNSLKNLNISSLNMKVTTDTYRMFYNCYNLTLNIIVMSTNITNYGQMFFGAATAKDSDGNYIGHITINYIPDDSTTEDVNESTESLVDLMIATKSNNSNIEKGCFGDNCPIINT